MNETDVNTKTVEQILKENEEMISKHKAKIKELFPQETNYLFDYDNTKQSTPKFLFETFGNNDSTFQCSSNNVKNDVNINNNISSYNKHNDDLKGKERINSFLKTFNAKMKLNLDNNNNAHDNNTINNDMPYNKYTFLKSPQSKHKQTTNITISDNDSDDNNNAIINNNKQQIVPNNKQRNKHQHHHYVNSYGTSQMNKPFTKIQPSKYKPKVNQRYKSNPNKKNKPHFPFNQHLTITPSMIFDKYNLNLNHPKRKLLYIHYTYIHI